MTQIRNKILAALLGVLLLMLAPTFYAVVSLRGLNRISAAMRESSDPQVKDLLEQIESCEVLHELRVATGDTDYGEGARECAASLSQAALDLSTRVEGRLPDPARALSLVAGRYRDQFGPPADVALPQPNADEPQPEFLEWSRARAHSRRGLVRVVEDIRDQEWRYRSERARSAEETSGRAVGVLWVSLAVAVVVAVGITSILARQIVSPLRRLLAGTKRVAMGRFDEEVQVTTRDELGSLTRAFNRMNRELASLDRMKAEFISIASHELKSPITSIKGYVEVLRSEGLSLESDERSRLLDQADSEADLLTRYVDQFMDMSRIETGRLGIEPRWLPAAEFFENEVDGFRYVARQEGVDLKMELSNGIPQEFRGDPDRMGEVVRNLLENALHYSPDGSSIVVRIGSEDGGFLRAEVCDSGPGIAHDEVEKVFQKYFRGRSPRVSGEKGSGLGLAISRGIIEAHQGQLWAESAPGRGARFVFRVPTDGPPAQRGRE